MYFHTFNIYANSRVMERGLFHSIDIKVTDQWFNLICISDEMPTEAFLSFEIEIISFKSSKSLPHRYLSCRILLINNAYVICYLYGIFALPAFQHICKSEFLCFKLTATPVLFLYSFSENCSFQNLCMYCC